MPPADDTPAEPPALPRGARVTGALLLLVAGAALGWFLREFAAGAGAAEGGEEESEALAPEDMRVRVELATVQQGEFSIVQAAVGRVLADPAAAWTIASRAGGRVLEAPLVEGQRVQQGALLVRFDPAPLARAVEDARALRARAAHALSAFEGGAREQRTKELEAAAHRDQTDLDLALSRSTRLEPLLAQGLVSEQALIEARQGAEQARVEHESSAAALGTWRERGAELEGASLSAELAAAEAGLKEAEAVLAEAEVRAPAAGRVARVAVHIGDNVAAGTELGTLLLGPGRRILFGLEPQAAARIDERARAWWTDALGATHAGRVQSRAPGIDPATGLVQLGVTPEGPEVDEPLGVLVHGELELEHLAGALLVPERSVVRSEDETAVVRVDGQGRAHAVPVRLLGRRGGLAAVEGELAPGDSVVVEGGYNLPDGARVVLDAPTPESPAPEVPEQEQEQAADDRGDGR